MKKNKPVLHDPLIINRVKQYLEENVHKTYLDVGDMTKELQGRYPEYTRRKLGPFRQLVEQAYRIVSESYGLTDQLSTDEDESDLEVMDDDNERKGLMGNMLNNLYAKSSDVNSAKIAEDAIDISSDNSDEETVDKRVIEREVIKSAEVSKPGTSLVTNQPTEFPAATIKKRRDAFFDGSSTKKLKLDNGNGNVNNQSHQHSTHGASIQKPQPKSSAQRHQSQSGAYHRQRSDSNGLPHLNQASNSSAAFPRQPSRPHKFKKEVELRKSREAFRDIGGMEKTLKDLCEVLLHIKSPDIYFVLGLMPPRGILLHGQPGCGKTLLARAIAGQLNLPLIEVGATELIAGISGESEERIRDVFEQALIYAPCVLFIDEIDAISSNRSNAQKDMERRIVTQLISCLDNLKQSESGQSVLVVGATTRPDMLDPALRRVGRFDHEIAIGIPSRKDRKEILMIICDGLSIEQKFDFDKIAELTPGYVGADLLALVSRAATIAVKRKCAELMRAFQAKTRSNITFVDLDDDNDVSNSGQQKEKPDDKVVENAQNADSENKCEKEKENDKKITDKAEDGGTAMEVDSEEKIVEKNATKENITEGNANKDKIIENDKEAPSTKKNEGVAEEGEDENNKENSEKIVNLKNTVKTAISEKDLQQLEPSLFELLNWLDNPPEDITYVLDFSIMFQDFCDAIKVVQPTSKREGFITVPDVTWDDVGSLQDIREELKLAVLAPVKFPEKLKRLGLSAPSGILLCGPPGCGKTLIAKAIANEAGINFISVKGPELMNMYVGESERAVRACFQRARNSAPCVIFFDEFDSLCPKRSENNESGSGTRVVNQLLTEMDGVEDRQGVYILAATNRPDIIDPAILRPGRLDTILYVGLPEQDDREEILKATTKNRTRPVLSDDVNFAVLAERTDGYTGADLAGLVRQASMLALKESLNNEALELEDLKVRNEHFKQAIDLLRPSVTAQDRKVYEKLRIKYAAPRPTILNEAEDKE